MATSRTGGRRRCCSRCSRSSGRGGRRRTARSSEPCCSRARSCSAPPRCCSRGPPPGAPACGPRARRRSRSPRSPGSAPGRRCRRSGAQRRTSRSKTASGSSPMRSPSGWGSGSAPCWEAACTWRWSRSPSAGAFAGIVAVVGMLTGDHVAALPRARWDARVPARLPERERGLLRDRVVAGAGARLAPRQRVAPARRRAGDRDPLPRAGDAEPEPGVAAGRRGGAVRLSAVSRRTGRAGWDGWRSRPFRRC